MVLLVIGAVIVALGLFSGAALVVGPLGLAPWSPDTALWVLFPLLSVVGYALLVIGGKSAQVRGLSVAVSGLLLLLATASAAGLVFSATAVIQPVGSTLSLWFVLAVAGMLGAIGVASHRSAAEPA